MWKPIETAPRDGSEFLGYAAGVGKFDVCRWNANSINSFKQGERGCYETVQHDGEYGPEDDEFGYWDATHWMPLPNPPAL